jgi:hypothetical protein
MRHQAFFLILIERSYEDISLVGQQVIMYTHFLFCSSRVWSLDCPMSGNSHVKLSRTKSCKSSLAYVKAPGLWHGVDGSTMGLIIGCFRGTGNSVH